MKTLTKTSTLLAIALLISSTINAQRLFNYTKVVYYKPKGGLHKTPSPWENCTFKGEKEEKGCIIKDNVNATIKIKQEEKSKPEIHDIYYVRKGFIRFHGGDELHEFSNSKGNEVALWMEKKKMWKVFQ